MRQTIQSSYEFMKSDPRIRELILSGLRDAKPYKKGNHRTPGYWPEDSQMFRKVWASDTGWEIRRILREEHGARSGVSEAARLYFQSVWEEYENVRK